MKIINWVLGILLSFCVIVPENVKMQTICWHFNNYEQEKLCSAELSMKKISGPGFLLSFFFLVFV